MTKKINLMALIVGLVATVAVLANNIDGPIAIDTTPNILYAAATTNLVHGAATTINKSGSFGAIYTAGALEVSCNSTNAATTNGTARVFYSRSVDGTTFPTQDPTRFVDINLAGTNTVTEVVPIDLSTYIAIRFNGIQVNSTTTVTNLAMRIIVYKDR